MCKERHVGRVGDVEGLANEVAKLPDGESGLARRRAAGDCDHKYIVDR